MMEIYKKYKFYYTLEENLREKIKTGHCYDKTIRISNHLTII